ncbi:5-(carboxyamino)imidazole ribonucleotide synthase [Segnochrobactrum spirostomi]|uniref:N5-carboxyaminoimidazole ribonucleotide synthase n=1 Tax=Segnochrobactrum spirostomi TaxID=2608987 RepID=A0A6A7Y1C7_9HYPH|nr:5-(carboxyamino)imidazole ribonucleotide synthase [Segnochrobactrum spirostomi]MQT12466.1 5-(carboxyamino)imidazole ribonucleotide synthase [Segnochrobactrum spirostomi]
MTSGNVTTSVSDGSIVLRPGATLGILGGGQLGRMIALAAARLGLAVHVYCPDPASPAFDVARAKTIAGYEDEAALAAFAAAVDVVTYEFENVPERTAAVLTERVAVRPGARSLAISQDRFAEKTFLSDLGIPVAPFAAVDGVEDLVRAVETIGLPAILKTRRFGYDGKGQITLKPGFDPQAAYDAIGRAPAILEGFVPFALECSVILARGLDGAVEAFDIAENRHENHILKRTRVPAAISPETERRARALGAQVAHALDHVGVLAVELFLVRDAAGERLVANEIAPRVHNSGHWTEDGATVSQFEQHVRAVAGWPLAAARLREPVEMENLIGDDVDRWHEILAEPGAHLHLYGKAEARPGRKMGHVNRLKA